MKILEVNLKMVIRVPEKTDMNDVMVAIPGCTPNMEVYTNGGLRKVRTTIPSWAVTRVRKYTYDR